MSSTTAEAPGTVIFTGASSALGLAFITSALQTYPQNTYLLVVRNASTSDPNTSKLQALLATYPSVKTHIVGCDLSDLTAVRNTASQVTEKIASGTYPPLRSFIANAYAWNLTTAPKFVGEGEAKIEK